MRRGSRAMRFDPGYFRLKLGDALGQFALRIGVEPFTGEETRSIASRARAIVVVHVRPR